MYILLVHIQCGKANDSQKVAFTGQGMEFRWTSERVHERLAKLLQLPCNWIQNHPKLMVETPLAASVEV